MIHFEDFIMQDEADKYNMLQEYNTYIKSKDREIKWLENQLQQKENIIKKVREYIENENYKEENICMINGVKILEILDKVDKEKE